MNKILETSSIFGFHLLIKSRTTIEGAASWLEHWRLPLQVRILLVLNGGSRQGYDRSQGTIRLVTKIALPIDTALNFAVMQ